MTDQETAKQSRDVSGINKPKYKVSHLERLTPEFGGGLAIVIENDKGKKFAASFPNGPDRFVPLETLMHWLRTGIDNLELCIEIKDRD